MAKITDAMLRPYGFVPGNLKGWCAACSREFKSAFGLGGFKCRKCAHGQAAHVNMECEQIGMEG